MMRLQAAPELRRDYYGGSWDLVARVIHDVTIVIYTYNST